MREITRLIWNSWSSGAGRKGFEVWGYCLMPEPYAFDCGAGVGAEFAAGDRPARNQGEIGGHRGKWGEKGGGDTEIGGHNTDY